MRFGELYRFCFEHLKFASPEELSEINKDFGEFLGKLTKWYGFIARIMEDNNLVPTPDSHQHQNYVLCHISENEIGASRVDHTSTVVDQARCSSYAEFLRQSYTFFGFLNIVLLQALDIANQNAPLNEERFVGYFDRAYKWDESVDGPVNHLDIPGADSYFKLLKASFEQGYHKEPVPISQEELIALRDRILDVEIDEERLREIRDYQDRFLSQLPPGALEAILGKHGLRNNW
ncbi:hypothetical protein GF386_00600 [Candidatus Pacearchaeota archaeon]|nr:hypothetical protein [Candidatus Pacearchaeota archaeon]MBD3282754.1 hypothetical protein [Candidatus Pacearchaeota archaeon]